MGHPGGLRSPAGQAMRTGAGPTAGSAGQFGVQARRLRGDRLPAELGDRPVPPGPAERVRAGRITKQRVQGSGQRFRVVRRDQQPGFAIADHLGDPADRGGHDRGAAGHRLQVHDAERFVQRRAGEYRRVRQQLDHRALGQHLRYPDHPGPRRAQVRDQALDLGGQFRRVRLPGAEHELGRRIQRGRGPQQHRDALLPGDPAHEDH